MKQTIVALIVRAAVLNEGEREPRKVNIAVEPHLIDWDVLQRLLEQALPEVHPGNDRQRILI